MRDNVFYVYILTNDLRTVLYIGVTSDICHRLDQHRSSEMSASFSSKYRTVYLIYLEEYADAVTAIAREKQLKNWSRKKKEWLIERMNPKWIDLSENFI